MEEVFLQSLKDQVNFRPSPEIECKAHILKTSKEEFTTTYLKELEQQSFGIFSRRKNISENSCQYLCNHYGSTRRKEGPHPLKSRATDCKAYISFKFVNYEGFIGCITRLKKHHTGHNVSNPEELRVESIHPSLEDYIFFLISLGKKPGEILVDCASWSKERGCDDARDRRYYPTPKDISNLVQKYHRLHRYHTNDSISVSHLLSTELKHHCVYYQQLSTSADSNQPLMVIMQTEKQKSHLFQFGKNMVFIDATYSGLTSYGFAVYAISVRNDFGHGIPAAIFIVSDEKISTLVACLRKLKEHWNGFSPRAFMVDKDMSLIGALKEVFNNSYILLCWFHVLQAVHRWLVRKDSGLSGPGQYANRKTVIDIMRQLKHIATRELFQETQKKLLRTIEQPCVTAYLEEHWMSCAHMWANFGRNFHHEDANTNNLSERFFLRVKYQFLRGYANRRLDELLLILCKKMNDYFSYIEELQKCGRIKNQRVNKEMEGRKLAQQLLEQGIGVKIVWSSSSVILVPSSRRSHNYYEVDLPRLTRDCPMSHCGGLWKHLNLAIVMAEEKGVNLTEERKKVAFTLHKNRGIH